MVIQIAILKFDHILAYDGNYGKQEKETSFDPYLDKGKVVFDEVFNNLQIKKIKWYRLEDAHHQFPTLHHLAVMLDTLGVKKQDVNNTVQSQTTTSD